MFELAHPDGLPLKASKLTVPDGTPCNAFLVPSAMIREQSASPLDVPSSVAKYAARPTT